MTAQLQRENKTTNLLNCKDSNSENLGQGKDIGCRLIQMKAVFATTAVEMTT